MDEAATVRGTPYLTIKARPGPDSLIKPGELVDLVEVTPLTLADRRIYNLLLENAWDSIDKAVVHTIGKARLRGNHNSNDRIGESIERLMAAIVKVKVTRDGQHLVERVQLLGGNVEYKTPDGMLLYEIPPRLRRIIKDSTIFARLQKEVMFALSSKYALTLYEMVQKRGNLSYRSSENFSVHELRGILGVPKGRLTTWSNLYNRAIRPGVEEVNQLSDYLVDIEPLKTGRQVTHIRLKWWKKDSVGVHNTARELSSAKVGRRARRRMTEKVIELPRSTYRVGEEAHGQPRAGPTSGAAASILPGGGLRPLRTETYETARLRHPGYDIYYVEQAWRHWAEDKEPPGDPDRAFLAFFRTYASNHPL
ncbi:MAG: replication initiation protein [Rhodospirillales bacterium]